MLAACALWFGWLTKSTRLLQGARLLQLCAPLLRLLETCSGCLHRAVEAFLGRKEGCTTKGSPSAAVCKRGQAVAGCDGVC